MILALYQCPEPVSLADGLGTISRALSKAAEARADMLVMPEAFLPGYTQAGPQPPEGFDAARARIATLCAKAGVALCIGLPIFEAGRVLNGAVVFGPDGAELARYGKMQLFGPKEAALYTPGDAYVTFDHGGVRFGLMVCYDVEFPEHVRALKRLGAEVILVPTANMMPFTNVNLLMVPARAAENGLSIVYANYCGTAGDLTYTALSGIFGPDGFTLANKGNDTGLAVADLPDGDWSEHGVPVSTQLSDLRLPPTR